MKDNKNVISVLKLDKLVFDKINFTRLGFKNKKPLKLELASKVSKKEDDDVYRVTLELKGNKPDEYTLEISLTGFFTIESDSDLTQDLIDDLITKNSVAIIMPYLRSEVSLLTAQPETESVILPVFNVNNMIDNQ